MSRFLASLGIALLVLLPCSVGAAEEAVPHEAQSGFSDRYGYWTPSLVDQAFSPLYGNVGTNLYLGCDGVAQLNLFQSLSNEVEQNFDYLRNNIAGLSVNYLVYSNPTLYSLLEGVEKNFQMKNARFNASCASVRAAASLRRQDEARVERARDRCLTDTADQDYCNNSANLDGYLGDVVEAEQDRRDDAAGVIGATNLDIVIGGMDEVDPDFEELVRQVMYDARLEDDGDTEVIPPARTVREVVVEKAEEYARLYDAAIGLPITAFAGSDQEAALRESGILRRMSPRFHARMQAIRTTEPTEYREVLGVLAQTGAIAWAEFNIGMLHSAIDNSLARDPIDALGPEDREQLRDALALVATEVSNIKVQLQAAAVQTEIMLSVQGF